MRLGAWGHTALHLNETQAREAFPGRGSWVLKDEESIRVRRIGEVSLQARQRAPYVDACNQPTTFTRYWKPRVVGSKGTWEERLPRVRGAGGRQVTDCRVLLELWGTSEGLWAFRSMRFLL